MIQRARVKWDVSPQDDPWGEKAYYAALARRPKNPVKDHLAALRVSTKVTKWFRREREPNVLKVTARNVIGALNRVGIRPVLMGTYGLGGYRSEARATQDVDLLVQKKEIPTAVQSLRRSFSKLGLEEFPRAIRFLDPRTGKSVIDVMKLHYRISRTVFLHSIRIGETHRIPDLEMALSCKVAAMLSPDRDLAKRYLDAGDLVDVIENNRGKIDLAKLRRLSAAVSRKSAARIQEFIADIAAGRQIQL